MRTLLLALTVFIGCVAQSQLTQRSINYNSKTIGFYEFKPSDYNTNLSYNYPVIISLHGVGERGNGLPCPNPNGVPDQECSGTLRAVLAAGIPSLIERGATMRFTWQGQQHGFIVLAPQLATNQFWSNDYIEAMIQHAETTLRINPNKIFVTGFSLGGAGTWNSAANSTALAAKLAGIAPVAAGELTGNPCTIASNRVAVWAFHSLDDGQIPASYTINNVAAVNACNPLIPARGRYYPDGAHAIWQNGRSYDTTNNFQYPNMYQWMLSTSRALPQTDLNPVANAGPNLVLTTPVKDTSVRLSGLLSTDPDDFIAEYLWEKLSGPQALLLREQLGYAPEGLTSIDKPEVRLIKNANGFNGWLGVGTYTFRLTVKDFKSNVNSTNFTVTIQLPPGNSKPDVVIGSNLTLPNNQSTRYFDADGYDADGSIAGYTWAQVSGPKTVSFNYPNNDPWKYVTVGGMSIPGVYKIQVTVTDNQGAIGRDTVEITQLANLPVNFAYFKGKNLGSKNILNWATSSEINNQKFEVLRSADGRSFASIGSVPAGSGSGTIEYAFEDATAPVGISYYQLRQVDIDGRSTNSKTISIKNSNSRFYVEAYPNPVKDILNVNIEGAVSGNLNVQISDAQGKLVQQLMWKKDQSALRKTISVNGLRGGLYQLAIIFPDGNKETSTFIKN